MQLSRFLVLFPFFFILIISGQNELILNHSESDELIILPKIIQNLFLKYLSDEDDFYITITMSSLKKQQDYFQLDFVSNFLINANFSAFQYNINNKLYKSIHEYGHVLNMILVENYESLQ